jgi:hypothetical protein
VLASGCATLDSRPPTEIVKERSQARWNALVAGDTKAAYQFFTPTTRSTLKYQDYADNINKGFWKSVTVDNVACESATVCTATASVTYNHKLGRNTSPVQETWIKDGANWWYAQK